MTSPWHGGGHAFESRRAHLSAQVAQLGERQTEDLNVPGSSPGLGIKLLVNNAILNEIFGSNDHDQFGKSNRMVPAKKWRANCCRTFLESWAIGRKVFCSYRINVGLKEIIWPSTYFGITRISGLVLIIYVNSNINEGFDLAPIRRALNSCVNIFNLYGCF